MRRLLVLALFACAVPAAAQGVPEPLRGTWSLGACAAPDALLHLTARSVVRLPTDGAARLVRFRSIRDQGGWTLGTGGGAEAPRVMLRAAGDGLETVEPDTKTRDDQLPGSAPVTRWERCAAPPPILALLHGEGIAFLGAMERIEAACQAGTAIACLESVVAAGDVSGDGLLGTAEVARLMRGAAWALTALDGGGPDAFATAAGIGGVAALGAARVMVESLDYDGDGRLSAAELGQDRAVFPPGTGTAAGAPVALEALGEGAGLLRAMLERLAGQ